MAEDVTGLGMYWVGGGTTWRAGRGRVAAVKEAGTLASSMERRAAAPAGKCQRYIPFRPTPSILRRSTTLFQKGGPRLGERAGTSVGYIKL